MINNTSNEPQYPKLTEDLFMLECMKHYERQRITSIEDFYSDMQRLYSIKKNLNRIVNNDLPESLVRVTINHFIILFNVFGAFAEQMLRYKIAEVYYDQLYAFIELINYNKSHIQYDTTLFGILKEITK